MSYFTDDTPYKSTMEPIIIDNNNLPPEELGLWDQNFYRFLRTENSEIATARSRNTAEMLTARADLVEQELGPDHTDKLKEFGYNPGFGAVGSGDPWLSTGRSEQYEDALRNWRETLSPEKRSKIHVGDEIEQAAKEHAMQVEAETSRKLQNTKYGWWAGIFGDIAAHLTDPLEVLTLGFAPNIMAGRFIAKAGQISLSQRAAIYAKTEMGAALAFETPNQFLNVKPYKEELSIPYTNKDAVMTIFGTVVLSGALAGASEYVAGAFRKVATGEWTPKQLNQHFADNYEKLTPEEKEIVDVALQALEHERLNPYGPTPDARKKYNQEIHEVNKHVYSTGRSASKAEIEQAELAIKPRDEDKEFEELKNLVEREVGITKEPLTPDEPIDIVPEKNIEPVDRFEQLRGILDDETQAVLDEMFPPQLRVQIADEIEKVTGLGRLTNGHVKARYKNLYQIDDNKPRARSLKNSLDNTPIEVPTEQFEWLGIKPRKVQANYNHIAKKRANRNPDDPLADPEVVRDHVEYVLSEARFAFIDKAGRWKLVATDEADRLVALDIEVNLRQRQYNLNTAYVMDPNQLERNINAAFNDRGIDAFRWKGKEGSYTTPDIAHQRKTLDRTGVGTPLSAEDIIKIVRQIQDQTKQQRDIQGQIQGSFDELRNLVTIARHAANQTETARHELIHALRANRLFTDNEWDVLTEAATRGKWIDKHSIKDRYKDVLDGDKTTRQGLMLEEAIAEEFSKWRAGNIKVDDATQSIFEKIKEILDRIVRILKSSGTEFSEDVFKKIEAGELKERGYVQAFNDLGLNDTFGAANITGAAIAAKATDPIEDLQIDIDGQTYTPRELLEAANDDIAMAENVKLCAMMGR